QTLTSSTLFPYTTLFRSNVNGLVNNAFADLAYLPVEDTPWSYWEEAARVSLAVSTTLSAELVRNADRSAIKSIERLLYLCCDRRSEEHTSELPVTWPSRM